MKQVSLYEAKTHLSSLVEEASAGAEIVITKNGKPMARLRPLEDAQAKREPRKLGQWAKPGKHIDRETWLRNWEAMDREIEADFNESIAKSFPGVSERAEVFGHAPVKRSKKSATAPRNRKRGRR